MIDTLKEVREALETGLYASREVAANVHVSLAGYKPEKHKAVDADVTQIADAITKLDALIAQRAAGDDGLAQQYTKLSAHCAMLEDKLATLTAALGVKQMADFVAKHGAQEKAEPVATLHIEDGKLSMAAVILADGVYPLYTAPHPAPSTSPAEPVGFNGLTQAETSASMSVRGLSKPTHKIGAKP